MYDFWENVLFYTGGYAGNPMEKHRHALLQFNLSHEHFERWVHLFTAVVNELYKGKNAKLIRVC
jgi:hemoglobin